MSAYKKCIILLSGKCSGSSAIQKLLCMLPEVNHIEHTRHYKHETLYWTKAASILGLPQERWADSEVPLPEGKARKDLLALLKDNVGDVPELDDDRELVFKCWERLCERFAPVFFEKSPHHLGQWSVLELILDAAEALEDVDFLLLGIVRNPMDTIYSAFQRWATPPREKEREWKADYENLSRLADIADDRLVTVRYEDVVYSIDGLKPVFDFCGVDFSRADRCFLHPDSLRKWRRNPFWGFSLSEGVKELARNFGYSDAELRNKETPLWPIYREASKISTRCNVPPRRVLRKLDDVFGIGWG